MKNFTNIVSTVQDHMYFPVIKYLNRIFCNYLEIWKYHSPKLQCDEETFLPSLVHFLALVHESHLL